MQHTVLQIRNLTTGYASHPIGRGLSVTLEAGTLCAILAPNGAGKSTLLRTLAGFIQPLDGQIRWMEKDMADVTPSRLAQMVSVVLTQRQQADALTVHEVVEMGRIPYASYWHRNTDEDRRLVDRAMMLTSTQSLQHRMVDTLSDGERQRVFIAKSLAQDTPVILLDEPTAFLDFPSKVRMLRLLGQLAHEKGKAILLSTHDVELALHMTDTLWLLHTDCITAGSPQQLAEKGLISHFFESEDIVFDIPTLRFIPRKS